MESQNDLCELANLHFQAGFVPDYTNIHIQQLYLLRYAFAYAFEYGIIYRELLSRMKVKNNIKITSIGCGTFLDYWSLRNELSKTRNVVRIDYIGIDEIDWNYRFEKYGEDQVRLLKNNATFLFNQNAQFISDIYFFPKSISEFSQHEFDVICRNFSSKPILNNEFYVALSLRSDADSLNRDLQRVTALLVAIQKNGYDVNPAYNACACIRENRSIVSCDTNFKYPQEILNYITNLESKCNAVSWYSNTCHTECQSRLNRFPTLRTGNMRFQILTCTRKSV